MPAVNEEIAAAEEEETPTETEIKARAFQKACEAPLVEDLAQLECPEYTEQEIQHDIESVDWEAAFEEVNEMER